MADMQWTEPDSTFLHDDCGQTVNTWSDLLNGVDFVAHLVTETHYVTIDMTTSRDISRVGLRGNAAGGSNAPTAINIYISDNPASFGTAVATGIDPSQFFDDVSWLDTIITRKTGRYMKIEITATQSTILGWGKAGVTQIRFWEGDIPKKFTTVLSMRPKFDNNFSNTFTPTNGSKGMYPIDGSDFNNITGINGVGSAKRVGTQGGDPQPNWVMRVYDRTNSQEIVQTSGASEAYETKLRVGEVINFPSGAAVFDVRYRKEDATSSQHMNFDLYITQESEATGNKTCVYKSMAAYHASMSTSYNTPRSFPLGGASDYQFKFVAADWDCTMDKWRFFATIRCQSTNTISVQLWDLTAASEVAVLTHNATTYSLEESADIKSSLVDGHIYTIKLKSTVSGQAGDLLLNAGFRFNISDMNAFPTFQEVGIIGKGNLADTAGWLESTDQLALYLNSDDYFSSDVTRILKYQGVALKGFSATSMSIGAYDDGVRDTGADITTTATNIATWLESGAITPADSSDITLGYNYIKPGFGGAGAALSGTLIKYISGLDLAGGEEAVAKLRMAMGMGL